MHLYGYLIRFFPPWLAATLFAFVYAAVIAMIVLLAPIAPADFSYGQY